MRFLTDAVNFARDELDGAGNHRARAGSALTPDCANAISVLDEEAATRDAFISDTIHIVTRLVMEYGRLVFRAVAEEDVKAGAKTARDMGKKLILEQKSRFARAEAEELSRPSPLGNGGYGALRADAAV